MIDTNVALLWQLSLAVFTSLHLNISTYCPIKWSIYRSTFTIGNHLLTLTKKNNKFIGQWQTSWSLTWRRRSVFCFRGTSQNLLPAFAFAKYTRRMIWSQYSATNKSMVHSYKKCEWVARLLLNKTAELISGIYCIQTYHCQSECTKDVNVSISVEYLFELAP